MVLSYIHNQQRLDQKVTAEEIKLQCLQMLTVALWETDD